MSVCCRRMDSDRLLLPFVTHVLQINDPDKKREAINSIAIAEGMLQEYNNAPTLSSKEFRDFEYSDDVARDNLRLKILEELIKLERTENDDDMALGMGGARPRGIAPKPDKNIYYVIGLPASGKSYISNVIADETGSYILDSDMAKRKLPEFKNKAGGATLVHSESDEIIFSRTYCGKNINLLNYCVGNGFNMVVPKIGYSIDAIFSFITPLKEKGYSAYLILVDLERMLAVQRAFARYSSTERYVPLSIIYDGYGNDPILNYYRIRQRHGKYFTGYLQLDTNVKLGERPLIIEKECADFFNI